MSFTQAVRHLVIASAAAFAIPNNVEAQAPSRGQIDAKITDQIGKRGAISELGPKLGLSREEIEQIRRTTGYITCPGTKFVNGTTGSATVLPSRRHVLTVAHMFWDTLGRRREPLDD